MSILTLSKALDAAISSGDVTQVTDQDGRIYCSFTTVTSRQKTTTEEEFALSNARSGINEDTYQRLSDTLGNVSLGNGFGGLTPLGSATTTTLALCGPSGATGGAHHAGPAGATGGAHHDGLSGATGGLAGLAANGLAGATGGAHPAGLAGATGGAHHAGLVGATGGAHQAGLALAGGARNGNTLGGTPAGLAGATGGAHQAGATQRPHQFVIPQVYSDEFKQLIKVANTKVTSGMVLLNRVRMHLPDRHQQLKAKLGDMTTTKNQVEQILQYGEGLQGEPLTIVYLEDALKQFARKCLDADEVINAVKMQGRNLGIQL